MSPLWNQQKPVESAILSTSFKPPTCPIYQNVLLARLKTTINIQANLIVPTYRACKVDPNSSKYD